nr:nucleolar protein 10 [Quercus suber]
MASEGGNLKSTSINGMKVYSLASQNRSHASWLDPKKLRALRKDKNYSQRVDLIQDLRFETATTKIKATPDGEFLIASGIYPPQVKVYELSQLSLKFERHLDSEIIDFQVLDEDYSKLAFLCADRSVYLHAKYGKHYSLRIPRMGRDMAYDCWSCDLLCAASSPDLYRINLEQGRFLSSLTTQSPAINVVSRSKLHGLVACGGEDGAIECFDLRMRSSVGRIDAVAPTGDIDQAKSLVDPFAYDAYLEQKKNEKLEKERSSRITIRKKLPKVNRQLAARILENGEAENENKDVDVEIKKISKKKKGISSEIFKDERFAEMFRDEEFEIDESSREYLALHPVASTKQPSLVDEHFDPVMEDEDLSLSDSDASAASQSSEGELSDGDIHTRKKARVPRLHEVKDERHAEAFWNDVSLAKEDKLPIGERVAALKHDHRPSGIPSDIKVGPGGSREISFVSRSSAKYKEDDEDREQHRGKKRGAKSLVDPFAYDAYLEQKKNEKLEKERASRITSIAYACLASTKQPSLVDEHFDPVMEDEDLSLSDSDASAASQSSEGELGDGDIHTKKKARIPRLHEVKDERHAEAFWNDVSLAKEDKLPIGALKHDHRPSGIPSDIKSHQTQRKFKFMT